VHWRLVAIEMRGRLSRLDFKLDLLLKHAGVEYDPYKNLPRDVVDALHRGEKIQAIQYYRKATGVGLKQAKDFIEDVQRRAGDVHQSEAQASGHSNQDQVPPLGIHA
jgi:Ribosomal protein L7/L12 C-terminal domain